MKYIVIVSILLTSSYANFAAGFAKGFEKAQNNALRNQMRNELAASQHERDIQKIKNNYRDTVGLYLIKYEKIIKELR